MRKPCAVSGKRKGPERLSWISAGVKMETYGISLFLKTLTRVSSLRRCFDDRYQFGAETPPLLEVEVGIVENPINPPPDSAYALPIGAENGRLRLHLTKTVPVLHGRPSLTAFELVQPADLQTPYMCGMMFSASGSAIRP